MYRVRVQKKRGGKYTEKSFSGIDEAKVYLDRMCMKAGVKEVTLYNVDEGYHHPIAKAWGF